MAKGANAKQVVEDKLRAAFGTDFLGVADKKIYVQADDGGGEMVQVAISMTCPKTPFMAEGATSVTEFSTGNFGTPDTFKPAEITEDELNNVRKMIKELGL